MKKTLFISIFLSIVYSMKADNPEGYYWDEFGATVLHFKGDSLFIYNNSTSADDMSWKYSPLYYRPKGVCTIKKDDGAFYEINSTQLPSEYAFENVEIIQSEPPSDINSVDSIRITYYFPNIKETHSNYDYFMVGGKKVIDKKCQVALPLDMLGNKGWIELERYEWPFCDLYGRFYGTRLFWYFFDIESYEPTVILHNVDSATFAEYYIVGEYLKMNDDGSIIWRGETFVKDGIGGKFKGYEP